METITTNQKKWYDKKWLVTILCIVFFPVGLYALWKSNNINKGWKIAWTVIIAFFVIMSFNDDDKKAPISSTNETSQSETGITTESSVEHSESTLAKIGDEISIENFSYRVNDVYFSRSLGNEFTTQTADGIYLIVDLSLKNMDKEEHTLDNSLFKLTDETGTEYESSNDGNTALEMSGQPTLFLKQCNPKIQKQGFLCFEVPNEGVYNLHLSGGFWSGKTAVVKLTK
jgi:hypothetical protein